MKIAMLSPIAWRTPPRHYGPWERVTSLITEGLVKRGVDVTLFATADSSTSGKLDYTCPRPYEEDKSIHPKAWECLHIAHLFEQASKFDLIHNNFDFLPLSYSRLTSTPVLTTIHGFSSESIVPVYKEYAKDGYYVSISNADRHPDLPYIATIHHGIEVEEFDFFESPKDYLVFLGRIHPDKGPVEAIKIAQQARRKLIIAGIIQDQQYFDQKVKPMLNDDITYIGSVDPYERSQLVGNAAAMLHPISFAEPFGLSVVESMAYGTPVIAFNRGSMPEVIDNERTGYLVANVDQAAAKVSKIHRIRRQNCRTWVKERFSRERMVDDYHTLYRQIIEKHSK